MFLISNGDSNFNNFKHLPLMQYNIIAYLMKNNEEIWKILKYSSPDCLQQPNLNIRDKAALIYSGQGISTSYRVFMNPIDDAFTEQVSLIRIFPDLIVPRNRSVADINFVIQVFSHVKLQYLSNYTNRTVYLMQQILETLNGVDTIEGMGKITFDVNYSRYNKAAFNIDNGKNYTGYSINLSTFTT